MHHKSTDNFQKDFHLYTGSPLCTNENDSFDFSPIHRNVSLELGYVVSIYSSVGSSLYTVYRHLVLVVQEKENKKNYYIEKNKVFAFKMHILNIRNIMGQNCQQTEKTISAINTSF
jgi:hypothetical protein